VNVSVFWTCVCTYVCFAQVCVCVCFCMYVRENMCVYSYVCLRLTSVPAAARRSFHLDPSSFTSCGLGADAAAAATAAAGNAAAGALGACSLPAEITGMSRTGLGCGGEGGTNCWFDASLATCARYVCMFVCVSVCACACVCVCVCQKR